MINLNLNERERARFAEMCRSVAKQAESLAVDLESGDETKIVIGFMIFSLCASWLSELQKIVMKAANDAKAEKDAADADGFLSMEESAKRL